MLLVPAELYIGYLHNKKQYKAARQEIEYDIRVWESIAKSCDDIEEAYEKGYAIARLVIYHYRLDMLDEYYDGYYSMMLISAIPSTSALSALTLT